MNKNIDYVTYYGKEKIMSEKINLKVLLDHNMKGRKLIDIINENNIPIETACGGKGKCGKCKVKVLEGNISDITENEKKL